MSDGGAALDAELVRGKGGWLFLAHDANQVMRQHRGELRLSPEELRAWRFLLESRSAWLGRLGIPYLFVVPPNPHSVYPEMLPDGFEGAARRPILQLLDYLAKSGSSVSVIYPLAELSDEKARRPVYTQTDTRWNDLGAFVAYARLLDELERKRVRVRRLWWEDVEFREVMRAGDLGQTLDPPEKSRQLVATVRDPRARTVSDNLVVNRGRMIVSECPAAPEATCLLFGDPYSYGMLAFLRETFRRLMFVHLPTLDFDLVRQEHPDLVVSMLNERFTIVIPYDLPKRSALQIEREKRAAGRVLRPS